MSYYMFPSRYPNTIVCTRCGYVGPSEVRWMDTVNTITRTHSDFFMVKTPEGERMKPVDSFTPNKQRMLKKDPRVRVVTKYGTSYKKETLDDDVDVCPVCGNHHVDGILIRKYDKELGRYILSSTNEISTKKPYIGDETDFLWNRVWKHVLMLAKKRANGFKFDAKSRKAYIKFALGNKELAARWHEAKSLDPWIKDLKQKYIWDAIRYAAWQKGITFKFDKSRSLYDQMKDYGLEGNLDYIETQFIKKFFPNYGKKNYIEVNEDVIDEWERKYPGYGSVFAKLWDDISYGFNHSKEMVVSRLAFHTLSRSHKNNGIIILRDKKLSVYERDIKTTLKYRKDIAEWYADHKDIMESPEMDLDRSEAPNGIKMINGKEYFFSGLYNAWTECDFDPSVDAARRFVGYNEAIGEDDYDDADESQYDAKLAEWENSELSEISQMYQTDEELDTELELE